MNLQMISSKRLADGHSGQKSTARRSDIRLSKIALYSASLVFFVFLPFPALKGAQTVRQRRRSREARRTAVSRRRQ